MPPKKPAAVKNEDKKQSLTESSTSKFGKYTIIKEIGHGSFADVYHVKDNQGKEFALKKIRKFCTVRTVFSSYLINS